MAASGRVIGIVLIGAGIVLGIAITTWIMFGVNEGNLRGSGAALGLSLLLGLIVLPLIGGGAFLFIRGNAEARELSEINQQRKLLDMVKTRGQLNIDDAVLELNTTRDKVQDDLHALVGRGLFSGYVDWERGTLYSVDARELSNRSTCPNCGGQLELAGKGLIKCPYCGAEIFI
ncbi:MAG TPA: hypothetical protein VD789_02590 [Thermomicrobiales bacterium]|nr:hypothetical protein [Thermomicrobiales bacterium]